LIYNKYVLTATYWHRYIYSGMLMKKLSSLAGRGLWFSMYVTSQGLENHINNVDQTKPLTTTPNLTAYTNRNVVDMGATLTDHILLLLRTRSALFPKFLTSLVVYSLNLSSSETE